MTDENSIPLNRKARAVLVAACVLYGFALIAFLNWSSDASTPVSYLTKELPLLVMAAVFFLFGVYGIYLGAGSLGQSQFPSHNAILPISYKVIRGSAAVFAKVFIIGGGVVISTASIGVVLMVVLP